MMWIKNDHDPIIITVLISSDSQEASLNCMPIIKPLVILYFIFIAPHLIQFSSFLLQVLVMTAKRDIN